MLRRTRRTQRRCRAPRCRIPGQYGGALPLLVRAGLALGKTAALPGAKYGIKKAD